MKIHAVAALISLLSLPGALSANLRDGRTTKRKLGKANEKKANEKKIKVPQSPPLTGVAPGDIPKVLIGVFAPPLRGGYEKRTPFLFELYKKLEDVCEIEVVISHRPFIDKATQQDATSSLYTGEYHALDSLLFGNSFGKEGFAKDKQYELSAPITKQRKWALLSHIDADTGGPVNSNLFYDVTNTIFLLIGTQYFNIQLTNPCTGSQFIGKPKPVKELFGAIEEFIGDEKQGLWIETGVYEGVCQKCAQKTDGICVICDELGEQFAFVQTGVPGIDRNAPPLYQNLPMMISKMGSGLSKTVDPCIKQLYGTQEYKNFCVYNKIDSRYSFDGGDGDDFYFNSLLNTPTNELDTGKEICSDGYCSCPSLSSEEMVTVDEISMDKIPVGEIAIAAAF